MLDKKVLIVDCDLRKPKVHRNFELIRNQGVSDVVLSKGNLDYRQVVQTYTQNRVSIDVLTAGSKISNPSELINSVHFSNLIKQLKEDYDLVLIDCPPISNMTDGVLVSKLADGMFLNCFRDVSKKYSEIKTREILVDNLCMQLVQNPSQFDVLVMPNLYGDIVSDLCAGLIGGLGVAQSANIGQDCAIFEAVHGSAPDIAGKGIANPMGLLRSALLMLNYIGENEASTKIENALFETLKEGKNLTRDLGGLATTKEFTQEIIKRIS